MSNSNNPQNYYARMKDEYSEITQTELWKHLESDEIGLNYAIDISRVCFDACTIAGTITELLPNFTKHDTVHIKCVLNWMSDLLDGNVKILSKEETALLIMAACCHDVGMSISKPHKEELVDELERGRLGQDLKEYFCANKAIDNEYRNRDKDADNSKLYERIIRDFVRQRHHLRVEDELGKGPFDGLTGPLRKDLVLTLCRSHGEDLSKLSKLNDDTNVRLYLLAILLRLADILNFDVKRSPKMKFTHAGLDNPQTYEEKMSADEHIKNQICHWTINKDENAVVCTGDCANDQIRHNVIDYIEWVRKEVEDSNNLLKEISSEKDLLVVKCVKANLSGDFIFGDFKLSVNAKKVIELLGSENVYGEQHAFLSELIQNSIDAILVRTNIDHDFNVDDGKIDVYIWEDDDHIWVRVEDNGIGMDENVIRNYFLKVGESYYNSYDFKKIQREGKNGFIPINRFGIGILSCFMNQSNTRLEVETKSFSDETVYRMDITSLEGYYSLYKVDRNTEIVPVSAPAFGSDIVDGYNRDYGTSICVKHKRNMKNYAVSSFIREIVDGIKCPLFDCEIHTNEKTIKLVRKDIFLNSIQKVMNGCKCRNLHDALNVYYLNSLEDYITDVNRQISLTVSELEDASIVMIEFNSNLKRVTTLTIKTKCIDSVSAYKQLSRMSDDLECLKIWYAYNGESLIPEEKEIFECVINEFKSLRNKKCVIYNGIAVPLDHEFFNRYISAFCFVNGTWFERVNLSKTKLLGKSDLTTYLSCAVDCINTFVTRDIIPYEVFEAIEQKIMDNNENYEESGIITIIIKMPCDIEVERDLTCLSCVYNLDAEISEDKRSLNVSFRKDDRISREEICVRYTVLGKPICFIDDNTIYQYYGFLNGNYPFVKWVMNNYRKLPDTHQGAMMHFRKYAFNSYNDDMIGEFYDYLSSLKRCGFDSFDDEIIEYMESIKNKKGNPKMIDYENP